MKRRVLVNDLACIFCTFFLGNILRIFPAKKIAKSTKQYQSPMPAFSFRSPHLLIGFFWLFVLKGASLFGATNISITANPSAFTISTATAGSQPNSVTNTSTSYSVTTSTTVLRITGTLNTAMPTGVTLQVTLAAPSGATSAGAVSMTTTAQNLVTSIPVNTVASSLTITYKLSATVAAAVVSNATRTLTLTLTT